MTDGKENSDMAIRKEELNAKQQAARDKKIREMTQLACDKNDEALKRLSKS